MTASVPLCMSRPCFCFLFVNISMKGHVIYGHAIGSLTKNCARELRVLQDNPLEVVSARFLGRKIFGIVPNCQVSFVQTLHTMRIYTDDEVTWKFHSCITLDNAHLTHTMIRQLAVFVLGLGFFLYRVQVYFALRQEKAELRSFLKENDLLDYEVKLHKFGKLQLSLFSKKYVCFIQLDRCHFEMIKLSLPSILDFKSQLPFLRI